MSDEHQMTREERELLGLDTEESVEAPVKRTRGKAAAPATPVVEEKRLHQILSNEELAKAKAEASRRIMEARHKAAYDRAVAQEEDRLRTEEGLTTGDPVRDAIVPITIDLPRFADKLMVNGPMGMIYWQGQTYSVPRHVADSLCEIMFNAWKAEDNMEGRDLLQQFRQKRASAINARTRSLHNAPVMMAQEPTGAI